jgi:hypothetical protein
MLVMPLAMVSMLLPMLVMLLATVAMLLLVLALSLKMVSMRLPMLVVPLAMLPLPSKLLTRTLPVMLMRRVRPRWIAWVYLGPQAKAAMPLQISPRAKATKATKFLQYYSAHHR